MKLEHEVVQDLYPLYIENDLTPSVKTAVDGHLEECEACKKFYETGEKTIQLNDMEEPAVSKALDDKIILKMKLIRLRLISVVLAGILFSMVFTDYINEREQLFMATDGYYDVLGQMDRVIDAVKNNEQTIFDSYEMNRFIEYNNDLTNHMNFIEEYYKNSTEFSLILNTQRLNAMLEVMKTRFNQGRWSETDETAYQALKEYLQSHRQDFREDYEKTHHGYSSYLHILDVKEMDQFYENVNLLTYSYTRFHKMPDQIEPLKELELKGRIADSLNIDQAELELEKESPVNDIYVYRFENKNGYGGEIDAVTGQITEYFGDTGPLTDGPIMDQEEAEKKARLYLEKIYGKDINLELVSLGFNFNSSANDSRYKVYSFKAVPKVQGYTLYTPFETETILNLNARNGELESFQHNPDVPSFEQLDTVNLPALSDKTGDKKAVVIYSALTGNFELVYMEPDLQHFDEGKFISAKTGLEEKIYLDHF
ncbi:zf-HC2 domain-containing protein [Mesobacillus subterraneus]|uniref:zf-HC2 domain-containing protein n=1 Tax=Mesobacillus subterraneus TaxID=285983 RepID=UPI0020408CC8|nr:zf-HC2 domain-containing protein [Mesobacillus subterraneus]MCM3572622.1 zf-HC2 domain-containing protein [Mesobacillus subterraneus]